jgi:hypothetical protein
VYGRHVTYRFGLVVVLCPTAYRAGSLDRQSWIDGLLLLTRWLRETQLDYNMREAKTSRTLNTYSNSWMRTTTMELIFGVSAIAATGS